MGGMPRNDDDKTTRSGIIRFAPSACRRDLAAPPPISIGVVAWHVSGSFRFRFTPGWELIPGLPPYLREAIDRCPTDGLTLGWLTELKRLEGVSIQDVQESRRYLDDEVAYREVEDLYSREGVAPVPTYCVTARCVHPDTGEFVNIGIVAWRGREIHFRFVQNWARVRAFFPPGDIVKPLRQLVERFEKGHVEARDVAAMLTKWHHNVHSSEAIASVLSPFEAVATSKVIRPEDFLPEP